MDNLINPNDNGGSEADSFDYNQLNQLGNRAIALGLIAGHGYYQGQYELLKRGEALLMSPQAAIAYLKSLIQSAEQPDD
jgi:hypothetical protein